MCLDLILTLLAIVSSAGLLSLFSLLPFKESFASSNGFKRLSLRTIFTSVLIIIVLIAYKTWKFHRYYNVQETVISELVNMRENRRPENVDAATWKEATNWTITAIGNVCFSEDHVSLSELKRLRSDVEKRLSGDVDLTTTDWIWERLGDTGSHGKQYQMRFESQYREAVYGNQ